MEEGVDEGHYFQMVVDTRAGRQFTLAWRLKSTAMRREEMGREVRLRLIFDIVLGRFGIQQLRQWFESCTNKEPKTVGHNILSSTGRSLPLQVYLVACAS